MCVSTSKDVDEEFAVAPDIELVGRPAEGLSLYNPARLQPLDLVSVDGVWPYYRSPPPQSPTVSRCQRSLILPLQRSRILVASALSLDRRWQCPPLSG